MVNASPAFSKLLEQYVFEVASTFITSVDDPATQSELIALVNHVESAAVPAESIDNQPVTTTAQQLESEWQQVLNKPVDQRAAHRRWRIGLLSHQVKNNEAYMTHLEQAVEIIQQQYQQAQLIPIREPHRSKMLGLQERALKLYHRHLARLRSLHTSTARQLYQLQNQNNNL